MAGTLPVAYYTMETGTGTILTDRSDAGNDVTGILSDEDMWNADAPAGSNSLYFTVDSDKVTIPKGTLTDFDVDDAFSLVCWIKMAYAASWKLIISNDGRPLGNLWYRGYMMALNNGRPYWMMQHQWNALTKGIGRYGLTQVADGTWKNLVMTYDGGQAITSLKIYVNGVEETYGGHYPPNAQGLTHWAGTTIISPADLHIGEGFNGLYHLNTAFIDEVSIWDFELDADEVTALYNSGSPLDVSCGIDGGCDGGGGLPSAVRKVGSVASSDIKKINGFAAADIKKIIGVG